MPGGTAARLRRDYKLPENVAIGGKTGTTQNNSDGWFMGITPNLVSGCWVGAEERNVHFYNTRYGQGANMALPIFGKYMEKVYANKSTSLGNGKFEPPNGMPLIELECNSDSLNTNPLNSDFSEFDESLF